MHDRSRKSHTCRSLVENMHHYSAHCRNYSHCGLSSGSLTLSIGCFCWSKSSRITLGRRQRWPSCEEKGPSAEQSSADILSAENAMAGSLIISPVLSRGMTIKHRTMKRTRSKRCALRSYSPTAREPELPHRQC